MFKTKVEGNFSSSLEKVFSFVSDLTTMEQYNSSVSKVTRINSQPNEFPGYKIQINLSIIKLESIYSVVQIDKMSSFTAKCTTNQLEFEDYYEFFKLDSGTKLIITDTMNLKGLLKLSEPILSPIMKREMKANMNRLISILEP